MDHALGAAKATCILWDKHFSELTNIRVAHDCVCGVVGDDVNVSN